MEKITIIKVGGKIVENNDTLQALLDKFAQIEGKKVLIHGGGRSATQMAARLGIETKMIDGRRVTDSEMLSVVLMVYGGLVNKTIVSELQKRDINALGLSGCDLNVIQSEKRPVKDVDYGFVGDVKNVDGAMLADLIDKNIIPVIAPLSFSKKDGLLNTNADTMAGEVAKALSAYFDTTLVFCFEKNGVLMDENNDDSVIENLNQELYQQYKASGIIQGGMIPKLDNAFAALSQGVSKVIITKADHIDQNLGTQIVL